MEKKPIYRFSKDGSDGDGTMKTLLGGKGANLAEMASLGIPVPPGFTITTEMCAEYRKLSSTAAKKGWMDSLMWHVSKEKTWLHSQFGYLPLVSVRSGAPLSMPGMMDTILNVGLDENTLPDWKARIGERAALDSYRRLIQMLGSVAYSVPMKLFEHSLAKWKTKAGAELDSDLDAQDLDNLIGDYLLTFKDQTGGDFPHASGQLRAAIEAVFKSWDNDRAKHYRKMNGISEDMGTAVNVQAMVFGNKNDASGTGVMFTRDPATGASHFMAEFLPNAQGEDVVAGIRTPLKLDEMKPMWPEQYEQLLGVAERLEEHYRDMMDLEFTIQDGELFMLQCRTGKRSALAAFRIAVDLVKEKLIVEDEALARLTPEQYKLVRRPRIDPAWDTPPIATGLPASVGVAKGVAVFSAEDAVNCTQPCVLIAHDTCPDDIAGMEKAEGILTANGGVTSHAAVVARGMDKPCVTGMPGLAVNAGSADVGGITLTSQTKVTLDGESGRLWLGDVPVVDGSEDPAVKQVEQWCLELSGATPAVYDWNALADGAKHIVCTDWLNDKSGLVALATVAKLLEGAVIDVTPPAGFLADEDRLLHGAFGPTEDTNAALVKTLAANPIKNAVVVGAKGDAAKVLKDAGYILAKPAETVADLLDPKVAPQVTPEFIEQVLGGQQVLAQLKPLMPEDRPTPGNALPGEYAVFTMLGTE
jgi:pyruvate,orthophosphate dikinase